MDFKLTKLQTALFVRGLDIAKYDKHLVIAELRDKVGDVFDAEPIALPFPSDAPPEIPRILLRSNDGTYTCNLALNRVDIFRSVTQQEPEDLEGIFANHELQTEEIFKYLKEKGVVVNRIGLTANFVGQTENKTAAEYLRDAFLVLDKLENPKELQIVYNKRARSDSVDFNHLIRIISRDDSNILLQIDINTIPEIMETSNFSKEDLEKILSYSIKKITNFKDTFPDLEI